jgi:hypothetical protein
MNEDKKKISFLHRLKMANFNVIYLCYYKYSNSLIDEIIIEFIDIFQCISLTINRPVKYLFNIIFYNI